MLGGNADAGAPVSRETLFGTDDSSRTYTQLSQKMAYEEEVESLVERLRLSQKMVHELQECNMELDKALHVAHAMAHAAKECERTLREEEQARQRELVCHRPLRSTH